MGHQHDRHACFCVGENSAHLHLDWILSCERDGTAVNVRRYNSLNNLVNNREDQKHRIEAIPQKPFPPSRCSNFESALSQKNSEHKVVDELDFQNSMFYFVEMEKVGRWDKNQHQKLAQESTNKSLSVRRLAPKEHEEENNNEIRPHV